MDLRLFNIIYKFACKKTQNMEKKMKADNFRVAIDIGTSKICTMVARIKEKKSWRSYFWGRKTRHREPKHPKKTRNFVFHYVNFVANNLGNYFLNITLRSKVAMHCKIYVNIISFAYKKTENLKVHIPSDIFVDYSQS